MKLVDIYCPECDYTYDTPEVIPGKPPSCPKCGEVHTRHLTPRQRAVKRMAKEVFADVGSTMGLLSRTKQTVDDGLNGIPRNPNPRRA